MRKREQGFTLIEIMVVIAIIAGLVGTVAVIVPQMQEKQRKLQGQQRLSDCGKLWMSEHMEKPGKPKYEGAAYWLWLRKKNTIRQGEEIVLVSPGDQQADVPDTPDKQKVYDTVDLDNPPDNLTSWTTRNFTDFPLSAESKTVQVIASDRQGSDGRTPHYKNGLNLFMDNGSCDFFDREKLGYSQDAPIVVGPESDNAMLKQVVYRKRRKE